eukprot:m.361820 g.361820  ORF g.361820 m.361820 type:complete len:73 (+) comp20784_c0_seq2:553-771(+)
MLDQRDASPRRPPNMKREANGAKRVRYRHALEDDVLRAVDEARLCAREDVAPVGCGICVNSGDATLSAMEKY